MHQLLWILLTALVGFLVSFLFGNINSLPADIYYLIYFSVVSVYFAIYIKQTRLDIRRLISQNVLIGILLGLFCAAVLARNVFMQPATSQLSGSALVWSLVWRGLIYGIIDGLLLSVFPYVATWRAFDVASRPLLQQIGFGLVAWIFVLLVTSVYHLGYKDFRSKKLLQANIGNTIISIPMLLSGNPISAPIAHAGMHIAAVIRAPETPLYLPPHKEK